MPTELLSVGVGSYTCLYVGCLEERLHEVSWEEVDCWLPYWCLWNGRSRGYLILQCGRAAQRIAYIELDIPVGNEEFSLGYESYIKILWYNSKPFIINLGNWQVNQVIGSLLDIPKKSITFFLNGRQSTIYVCDFFSPTSPPKKYFPVITAMPLQQFVVNLGQTPFRTAPTKMHFSRLSSVGQLTPQDIMMYTMPRHRMQAAESAYNASEDACDICCDRTADVTLKPCGHRTLCGPCASQLLICPVCTVQISKRN